MEDIPESTNPDISIPQGWQFICRLALIGGKDGCLFPECAYWWDSILAHCWLRDAIARAGRLVGDMLSLLSNARRLRGGQRRGPIREVRGPWRGPHPFGLRILLVIKAMLILMIRGYDAALHERAGRFSLDFQWRYNCDMCNSSLIFQMHPS